MLIHLRVDPAMLVTTAQLEHHIPWSALLVHITILQDGLSVSSAHLATTVQPTSPTLSCTLVQWATIALMAQELCMSFPAHSEHIAMRPRARRRQTACLVLEGHTVEGKAWVHHQENAVQVIMHTIVCTYVHVWNKWEKSRKDGEMLTITKIT